LPINLVAETLAGDMFTGIVTAVGVVREILPVGGDFRILLATDLLKSGSVREGDSVSVSGACLTMLQPGDQGFAADVSAETLAVTTLGSIKPGQRLNLELAMSLSDRLGGHLVTGHVDGMARLVKREPDGRAQRFDFELPGGLERYVARKGSVCIDGVSLTVNSVAGKIFSVCLIPHTLEATTLGSLECGGRVNIEVDLIARYLEQLGKL
jgi:riboflavin synthase